MRGFEPLSLVAIVLNTPLHYAISINLHVPEAEGKDVIYNILRNNEQRKKVSSLNCTIQDMCTKAPKAYNQCVNHQCIHIRVCTDNIHSTSDADLEKMCR